jgi:hypothetical protein
MVSAPPNNWLTNKLKEEVANLFQPLYKRPLTDTEITDIANTLANTAELWVKFNQRIEHISDNNVQR